MYVLVFVEKVRIFHLQVFVVHYMKNNNSGGFYFMYTLISDSLVLHMQGVKLITKCNYGYIFVYCIKMRPPIVFVNDGVANALIYRFDRVLQIWFS